MVIDVNSLEVWPPLYEYRSVNPCQQDSVDLRVAVRTLLAHVLLAPTKLGANWSPTKHQVGLEYTLPANLRILGTVPPPAYFCSTQLVHIV